MKSQAMCGLLLLCACAPERPANGPKVAALAFRDVVPTYQYLGSREFSLELMSPAYDDVTYLEQHKGDLDPVPSLTKEMDALARDHDALDVYLLVNGGDFSRALAEAMPETRRKVRLVYNTAGGGGHQSDEWQKLGVQVYVAHPGWSNLAPFFYVGFLPSWTGGASLDQAVEAGNDRLRGILDSSLSSLLLSTGGMPSDPSLKERWWTATAAHVEGAPAIKLRPAP